MDPDRIELAYGRSVLPIHLPAGAEPTVIRKAILPKLPDASAAIRQASLHTVGLLGTRFTMEEEFYRGRLQAQHDLATLIPPAADRDEVHRIIYEELCRGEMRDGSREAFRRIIRGLVDQGAGGIILACTEIGLLVKAEDSAVPLFDSAAIHARRAAERALDD